MGGMVGGGGGGGGGSSPAAPQYGSGAPGVEYINPRASTGAPYVPSYAPQSATPFLQSVMAQHGTPLAQNNNLGLPSLQSMFGMQQGNTPYQSGLRQLAPLTPYVGSTYRPDMSGAIAKLSNVAAPVSPEQISSLDNYGKPIVQNPIANMLNGGGE
jgi:hypothetical protein